MGGASVRLLLDTHIWLWSLQDPHRLSKRVVAALTNDDNECWLSPISVWEFLLLVERGRVEVVAPSKPEAWVEEAFARAPLQEAPLTHEVAVVSRRIPVAHEDPADRFLAATAAVYDLTLVTSDQHLLRGRGYRTLANR
jgi:PIN domain nuclease of toxin-antitoxin system